MRTITATVLFVALAGASTGFAGQASFTLLATEDAPDVTIDEFGRTLVLTLGAGGVFIYEDGAYNFVGSGDAHGLSADGSWVGGSIFDTEGVKVAARGAASGGWLELGALGQCDSSRSSGYDVSADGSRAVGLTWVGLCNAHGFLWTEEAGMIALEEQGNRSNRASVISANGEVIAGFAQASTRTPAAWLASTGLTHPTYPFSMDANGEIGAMTSDGSVLAGQYYDDSLSGGYFLPYYWSEQAGIVVLPPVTGYVGGYVLGVSDDARTFVGISGTILTGRTATVWRQEWGAVDLKEKLIELGANVPENFLPQVARGLTTDGQTVVGWGILFPDMPDEQAVFRGFIATLPPAEILPCPADLNGDGAVGFIDLPQLLSAWGPCPGCDEDLDDNDQVGFSDLSIMLNAWGPCP